MPPKGSRIRTKSPAPTRTTPLPQSQANALIQSHKGRLHSVKTQTLDIDEDTRIVIARVKVPTPKNVSGHLIRRFDTDAVSASSLFRVAYPTASSQAEQDEMDYLRRKYNTAAAGAEDELGNGRLTGTWIPAADAVGLAREYGLSKFVADLVEFNLATSMDQETPSATNTPAKENATSPPASSSLRSKRARLQSPRVKSPQPIVKSPEPSVPAKSTRSAIAAQAKLNHESTVSAPPTPSKGTVTVSQKISHDPETHETIEETTVKVQSDAINGSTSNDQILAEIQQSKQLVQDLKEAGVLQTVNKKKKRVYEAEEEAEESEADADTTIASMASDKGRGFMKRMLGRKKKTNTEMIAARKTKPVMETKHERMDPGQRRLWAFAGVILVGATTAAAPYFF